EIGDWNLPISTRILITQNLKKEEKVLPNRSQTKIYSQNLPNPIGIICEYGTNKEIVCVMRTIGDFCSAMTILVDMNNNMFYSRINKPVEKKQIYPSWSFVKLPESYKDGDPIHDQKIKDINDRTINDININTVILSGKDSPKVISDNFDNGLIENFVYSFIGN